MSTSEDLLKIGEFARLAGTNLRTLRYYEELGLMRPATRSEGGFRYYRRTDLNRLNMIRHLQELGLQLERIGELLDTRRDEPSRDEFVGRVRHALSEQDRLIGERIEQLKAQRSKLAEAVGRLTICASCEHQPRPENNFCEPCQASGEALPTHLSALF